MSLPDTERCNQAINGLADGDAFGAQDAKVLRGAGGYVLAHSSEYFESKQVFSRLGESTITTNSL